MEESSRVSDLHRLRLLVLERSAYGLRQLPVPVIFELDLPGKLTAGQTHDPSHLPFRATFVHCDPRAFLDGHRITVRSEVPLLAVLEH